MTHRSATRAQLAATAALLLLGCRSKPKSEAKVSADPTPVASTSSSASAPRASGDATAAETELSVPTVDCDAKTTLRWVTAPTDAFSCSPLATAKSAPASRAHLDAAARALGPVLELTAAPGTAIEVPLALANDRGTALAHSTLHLDQAGAPTSGKLDASSASFRWTVDARAGALVAFTLAARTSTPEGERCLRQPVVVHVVDDDTTRAAQAGLMVRNSELMRLIGCTFRHQGPEPDVNARLDLEDERSARSTFACGGALASVTMFDVDADGSADALVSRFAGENPDAATNPSAPYQTGAAVTLLLRRGDGFVRAGEAPGTLAETVDGARVILETDDVERTGCPQRPFASTGGPNCPIMRVAIHRLEHGKIVDGPVIAGADRPRDGDDPSTSCRAEAVEILKDKSGRINGYKTGASTFAADGTPKK